MTNTTLMKVKSIAECSSWSILQYCWPALSDNWYWKTIFGLFERVRFTQVLLYLPSCFLCNCYTSLPVIYLASDRDREWCKLWKINSTICSCHMLAACKTLMIKYHSLITFTDSNLGPQVINKMSCSDHWAEHEISTAHKSKIPTDKEVSCFKSLTGCIYHANKC